MVSFDDAMLLLRGFLENKTSLRVAVNSPELTLSASCTVHKVESGRVSFWIGDAEDSAIDFLVADCVFEYRDLPHGSDRLPLGKTAESCISVLRPETGFGFIIVTHRDGE